MIEVRYECGIYLPAQDLWLDPREAKRFAFISHAHGDHIAPHEEIILSERTARLLQARMPGTRIEHVLPLGEQRRVHDADVTLLPAGHIFGSAQLFLSSGNETLLYTGDFKLRHGKSADAAEWREANTLIMETTFGLPRYQFPRTEQVIEQIVAFCRETIEDGAVPVLLGYSLGKAQEILCSLDGAGLTPMLHGSVYQMTRIYEQFGQSFCKYVRYNKNEVAGKVLICPPSASDSVVIGKIPRKRVAMISGWAVDPNAIYRYQVDAAFPLSDHADYNDLVRYVDLVQPKRVFTLHGFAGQFAWDLRERGVEAWALSEENQMEFPSLGSARVPGAGEGARDAYATQSEFLDFTNVGESIAVTPAQLEKVRLLAEYLHTLNNEQLQVRFANLSAREDQYVVKILTGDLRTGLREGLVEEAIARTFEVPLEQVKEANMLLGDIGATASLASQRQLDRAELSIFRPIKCMLATPEPTAEAIWDRFNAAKEAAATVFVEDKFDGIRAQLHRNAKRGSFPGALSRRDRRTFSASAAPLERRIDDQGSEKFLHPRRTRDVLVQIKERTGHARRRCRRRRVRSRQAQ